ncbi:hypothetical protein ACFFU2_00070 [Halomonas alkalicola]|jgi:hypothetical protein|uniref:Uncharacterized protein n=1 Tax=Halomonas alkalicola TaxID=1930622 RepID=A0ABY9H7T0_9GAMM|nr:hypothetical protein [Halomonas alkalicola]WLI74335.1 hypothetical protein B6N23_05335 [Halomonas alkalicola]
MSLYGLRRSLFARWPGMFVLWLLAWSVGAAYACSPQLEVGEPESQVILAVVDESPSQHPENCDDPSPGITASLGKVPAEDLRNPAAAAGLPLELFSSPFLLATRGEASHLCGLATYSSPPVYLATARLRI